MIALIARVTAACGRHAAATLLVALVLAGSSLYFSANNLKIDTDTSHLFDPSLPWPAAVPSHS
jgi:predicted RND superfamily exporter protein